MVICATLSQSAVGYADFQEFAHHNFLSVCLLKNVKKLLTRSCDCGNITHVVAETTS